MSLVLKEKREKLEMELWIEIYSTVISMNGGHSNAVTEANKAVTSFRLEFDY